MNTSQFQFGLMQEVSIILSGECGQVRARAEWATGNISYFVAYKAHQGEYREAWLDQDLLEQSPKHTTVERGVPPEFLAAVEAAVQKVGPYYDGDLHQLSRRLIVNKKIAVADLDGKVIEIDNPHYNAESIDTLETTLRRLAAEQP